MPQYLVDVNLPCYVGGWQKPEFLAQKDIDRTWDDEAIWEYAKANNLTIITKDTDFQDKILFQSPPPKVIWVRLGNMRLREFITFLDTNWKTIQDLSATHKLVVVYVDRIEALNEVEF